MHVFTDENIRQEGAYLYYRPKSGSRSGERFIARHKHMRRDQLGFKSFLKKNFTVEEYFARIDAGEAPLDILKSKGYMPAHADMRRALGLPQAPQNTP